MCGAKTDRRVFYPGCGLYDRGLRVNFHQDKKCFSDQHLPHRLWGSSSIQSVQEVLSERASKTTTNLCLAPSLECAQT